MEELTTKEYNELYKKYFKEIFNKPMKDFGYKKKGTGKFFKLNKLGLFEYIGFFRYYHELRVEYAIIPIYSYIMKDAIGNGGQTEFLDLDGEEKMEKLLKNKSKWICGNEKSSTPNSTEVKIMINHGKENLKRGVY